VDLNLNGKKVFVSGSSRGIGLGVANKFIDEGANVVINSRNPKELKSVVASIENCHGVAGDVSNPEVARLVIEEAAKILGGIDIVVCNVGSGSSVAPGEETFEEWMRVFSVNFFSAINVISASSDLLETSGGSIVCISSICGSETIPGAPVTYSVAKAALNTYVKSISFPMGLKGIRINCVAPGNINFEGSVWSEKLTKDPDLVRGMLENNVPLRKLGSPNDVANLVVLLASDVSNFVTGSIFTTDGGQTRS